VEEAHYFAQTLLRKVKVPRYKTGTWGTRREKELRRRGRNPGMHGSGGVENSRPMISAKYFICQFIL
jgi:hypothetical protein